MKGGDFPGLRALLSDSIYRVFKYTGGSGGGPSSFFSEKMPPDSLNLEAARALRPQKM